MMRINISDVADQYPFQRVPIGVHHVPTSIELDDGSVVETQWLVELAPNGTLYFANGTITPDGCVEDLRFWHRANDKPRAFPPKSDRPNPAS